MHSASVRSLWPLSLVVGIALLTVTTITVPAEATDGSSRARSCPHEVRPPAPVSSPERKPPGPTPSEPLPVPSPPVGGPAMAGCRLVLPRNAPEPPKKITAASWVIQDLDSGTVLAAKAPHARQRPASLIKLLLALVVIEKFEPDDEIAPTVQDISTTCSCAGLVAGAEYSVDTLMHGLLMVSANDIAHAFGTALGGQRAALTMMNDLAERLGALDTRATSTSGLDARGMVTSAYDISVIYNYAMEQPRIARILGTKKTEFPGKGKKDDYPIRNDNDLLGSYPGFLGGKTGFTDNARHTYVGGAHRGERNLAVVLLRGAQKPIRMSEQAARLLDYGFTLARHGRQALGTIVEHSPAAEPTTTGEYPAAEPEDSVGAAASSGDSSDGADTTPFIIGLVIALLLAVTFTLARRKNAGR